MDKIVGVITLIITMAIIAVVLSPRARTAQVLREIANGLSNLIKTANAPVR